MSFVDTVGPFIFFCILGFAIAAGVLAWVFLWLLPKTRQIRSSNDLISTEVQFARRAKDLVNDLIAEDSGHPGMIPKQIMDQVWQLRDLSDRQAIPTRGRL